MNDNRQTPNIVVCNSLISACASAGQWELALCLLEKMQVFTLEMDIFSVSGAINACEKGGEWRRALHLCNNLLKIRLAPNVVAISSAITACAKASRWEISLFLLHSMGELQVQANAFSYSSVMSGCQKVGSWHQALELFRQMPTAGLVPDVVSCNAAFQGIARWEMASQLVDEMDKKQVPVNELSFNSAIGACATVNEVAAVQATAQSQSLSVTVLRGLKEPSNSARCMSYASGFQTVSGNFIDLLFGLFLQGHVLDSQGSSCEKQTNKNDNLGIPY